MMDMVFDTATGQLSVDNANVHPWGADLRAMLNRHGQVVNLRGIEMRLTITADDAGVFDLSLPPNGVRYKQTDQDILATGHVSWLPDQQIEVSAWCRTHAGHEVTAEAAFTAPRPAQPYPSWTWQDSRWTPPVPYPDDDDWHWDEDAGAWVALMEAPEPDE